MSTEHSNCPSCSSTVEHPRIACVRLGCPRAAEIEADREILRARLRGGVAKVANTATRALFGRRRPDEPPSGPARARPLPPVESDYYVPPPAYPPRPESLPATVRMHRGETP
jgi:hypothetical protein